MIDDCLTSSGKFCIFRTSFNLFNVGVDNYGFSVGFDYEFWCPKKSYSHPYSYHSTF